jgi:hypothetical protein
MSELQLALLSAADIGADVGEGVGVATVAAVGVDVSAGVGVATGATDCQRRPWSRYR